MRKKILLLFAFVLFSGMSFAQTKYLIYFKDKDQKPSESLSKSSALFSKAEGLLSQRSIERRKKVMGGDSFVTYEDLPVKDEYLRSLESLGIKIQNVLKWFNAASAFLTDSELKAVLELPFVEKVEKVKALYLLDRNLGSETQGLGKTGSLLDLDYGSSLRQLRLSDVPQVHRKGISGKGVIIGILDSGFDWKTHESLRDKVVIAEHDFVFNDNVTANQEGDFAGQDVHGTAVFSILAGYAPGKLIGPSYGAEFILAKTEDTGSERHIEEDNYAAALEWMEGLGVDITSSSLGYNTFDAPEASYTYADMNGKTALVTRAAEMAFQRGVLTMTAAGNEGNDPWHYITAPADGFNTIAVGAVSQSNVVTSFSSKGPTADGRIKPDIVAQGGNVFEASAHSADGYTYGNGTSFATPIASGCAGLLLSAYPYLSNVEMRKILLLTADNAKAPDSSRGYGLVSALKSIEYPNIERTSAGSILHKAFLDSSGVMPESVKMYYSFSDSNFTSLPLLGSNSTAFYSVQLPFSQTAHLRFYFTYTDSLGRSLRSPQTGSFNMDADTLDTYVPIIPGNYVLSQNYPNPFNRSTRIDFTSLANQPAELMIFDILGRRVFSLDVLTKDGLNSIVWNGIDQYGSSCSSGIYLYTLKLQGNVYSRKMVLLK
ncbi:MAG: S8 family serine peptidase [Ignavibacteria bacterium]|jgi:subtilisin family serine protease|nr:S8 family serine peptidase [Ignavibacteria bacterium]MCU7503056.1 S8 family serine peptidase [Ignavibacteria bacterium]MCU7516524.1 S8 family serine peptidase [Ignavibacteria bacterium]